MTHIHFSLFLCSTPREPFTVAPCIFVTVPQSCQVYHGTNGSNVPSGWKNVAVKVRRYLLNFRLQSSAGKTLVCELLSVIWLLRFFVFTEPDWRRWRIHRLVNNCRSWWHIDFQWRGKKKWAQLWTFKCYFCSNGCFKKDNNLLMPSYRPPHAYPQRQREKYKLMFALSKR